MTLSSIRRWMRWWIAARDTPQLTATSLEAMRALRNKQIDSDFIMVTAANDRETLEEALRLGVIDYLVKPFTFDRFQQALDKFLLQRQALYKVDSLNQKTIDSIITTQRPPETPPKGVQIKTMNLLYETLKNQKHRFLMKNPYISKITLFHNNAKNDIL